jgi:hypothetical protein
MKDNIITPRESTKMELAIPHQKLEISKLHIIPQNNNYLPFEYKDGDLTLHRAVILTPILKVINFDPEKGRIEFETDIGFIAKMSALQEVLKSVIFLQQKLFINEQLTRDQIDYGFKMLTYGSKFTLYIPSANLYNKWVNRGIHAYEIDGLSDGWLSERDVFKVGAEMRLAIKFGGIKIKNSPRGINFFMDHQIVHVWKIKANEDELASE